MNLNLVIQRIGEIIQVPFSNPELIPSIIPLAIGFILIELYFGRYKNEEMGWNSAVGNTTLLISTSLMLFYSMFMGNSFTNIKILVATTILGIGTLILILDFFHIASAQVAFAISSPFVIYFLTYGAIAIFYAGMPLNLNTLAAFGILFGAIFGLVKLVQQTEG